MTEELARQHGAGGVQVNHRVLIVDDDRDFADALGASLEMQGYGIAIAGNADEALELASSYRPEVSLLDLRLGQSNGLDLLPVLRQRIPDMMCLVLTAYADLETAIGAVHHRADDYLRKPMPPEEIARVLDRCFARRQRVRARQALGSTGGGAGDQVDATEERLANFLTFLRLQAGHKGGKLTSGDLEALGRQFHTKVTDPDGGREAAWEGVDQLLELEKELATEHVRENVFGRLMVERFAHLLGEEGGRSVNESGVSRRILPGFFVAISMMLGSERLENYQERCRRIVSRIKETRQDGIWWDDFYADDETKDLALDAEIGMALYFSNLDRRIDWFVDVINRDLGPASAGSGTCHLSTVTGRRLLGALFSDIGDALSRRSSRAAITDRYDAEKCVLLAEIAAQLSRTANKS